MAQVLKKHVRIIHHNIRSPCDICGKQLSSPNEVKIHIQNVHEGIRNYKCDYCDKKFGRKEHMRTHLRTIHKDVRNYKGIAKINEDLM